MLRDAQLIMLQNTLKQAGQFIKREDSFGPIQPAPERKPGPIINEILELEQTIEELAKQHFNLADQLRGIYPAEGPQVTNKVADGVVNEPCTGCEIKDRLAGIKQKALYKQHKQQLQRLYSELADKLWI